MSDSISKWYENNEDDTRWHKIAKTMVSEGHKKQAYQILVDYPAEAIFEAARILKDAE